MDKQKVMDDVIEFFSGSVIEGYTEDQIRTMSEYEKKWLASDATYDTPEGSDILDKIIDDCVDEVMKIN